MKIKLFLLLFTILLTTGLFAQESITNIVVTPHTDGTGMVDIYYDLSGLESDYTITLEASLDGGTNFTPVANTCITGDIGSIAPGTGKSLLWDGLCTYPETYSIETKIKLVAIHSGGSGTPCPGTPTVTDIDGNIYNTVQIGIQCWMAESLNVGVRIDAVNEQINNSQIEKYCYNDDPANCTAYGGLYQWAEIVQYLNGVTNTTSWSPVPTGNVQGICPTGWHLPSDEEWKKLEGEADSQYGYPDPEWDGTGIRGLDAGLTLKSTSGWDNNGNGTDLYGFGALPGGFRDWDGQSFGYLGDNGFWWSSSEKSGGAAWGRVLGYDFSGSHRQGLIKAYGFAVRCLKN